jgi:hypothetical protein
MDPATASALVDRLDTRAATQPARRAQLYLQDGLRLATVDSARAEARLRQAADVGGTGDAGERARLELIRMRLTRASSIADLPAIAKELDERIEQRNALAGEAGQLRASVSRILMAGDSLSAGAAQSDLRLFLAAEAARDSLAAPRLAAQLFRTIVEATPESPYAPKAILAGQALDPVWGASAVPLLEDRYAASPYVAFLQGYEPYGFVELEDSLRTFALSLDASGREGVLRPGFGRDSLSRRPGARPGAAPPPRRGLEP